MEDHMYMITLILYYSDALEVDWEDSGCLR